MSCVIVHLLKQLLQGTWKCYFDRPTDMYIIHVNLKKKITVYSQIFIVQVAPFKIALFTPALEYA